MRWKYIFKLILLMCVIIGLIYALDSLGMWQ